MRWLRRGRLAVRVIAVLLALVAPAAAGRGGRATWVAASAWAKTLGQKPHLSCHGAETGRKDCCCKGQVALRAAGCDCHDGQKGEVVMPSDPLLPQALAAAADRPAARPRRTVPAPGDPGRDADAPDPQPPPLVSPTFA